MRKIELFLSLNNKQRKQVEINVRDKMLREFDRNIVINIYLKEIYRILNNQIVL
jgi:hypothetical protein